MRHINYKQAEICIKRRIQIIYSLLILLSLPLFGQGIKPKIDRRVEIVSIAFRLAGGSAYNSNYAKKYVSEINAHFDKYSNDTLILFTKKLLYDSMSADGVITLAVNLDFNNGKFSLIENWKEHISPRWKEPDAYTFVDLLNGFYEKTKADTFFEKQQSYYNEVIEAFEKTIPSLNLQWYYDFYGVQPNDRFNIVIGCGNGTFSYGPTAKLDKENDIYAIIGSHNFDDKTAKPYFDIEYDFSTLVHEFNHPFANPVFYDNKTPLLEKYGTILFDSIPQIKQMGNRDGNTLLIESFVRAAVVRYMIDNNIDEETIKIEIANQMELGYIWIKEMVNLFGYYERNRNIYPTMENFYPEIIDFFRETTENINELKSAFETKRPKIIGMEPFENQSNIVNPSTTELTINFNKRVKGDFWGHYPGSLGKEGAPRFTAYEFINENTGIKIKFILEPNKEYEFVLYFSNLRDENGYTLTNYPIKFKTK